VNVNHTVIPEAAQRLSGIHNPGGDYGFRARTFGASRNDDEIKQRKENQ
jgi:hypothetical protein